jgi:two-component system, NtrC family, sensor kinase
MSVVKAKLALLSADSSLSALLAEHTPVVLSFADLKNNTYDIDILIYDSSLPLRPAELDYLASKKGREFLRIIFLLQKKSPLDLKSLSCLQSHYYIDREDLNASYLHAQWQELTQQEQDETYLSLSTELNQQYETLKTELEDRLSEKSKNLIESRKQIFEINNRVEVLRKSLYATSEVKSLKEAEIVLNDLLVSFAIITWLKIINPEDVERFEADLKTHLDSNFHSNKITINSQDFYIYFFKGDRRAFKKPDLNYFSKLTEALQINLNRYNNLLSLQQSERLFDLAFHSSPHPIIIIDNDYHVFQANLAAEQKADDSQDNLKCHELLFGRPKPCIGCHLGSKFEIQHDVKTYAVQSSKFNNLIDSSKIYWIHLYEDVSEQRALESKFQQTARLSELGLISSSIAHELNNPLGGILSYLQIMKMELPAQHPFLADITFLTEAANRMKKHIEDLLLFSRKEDSIKLEKVDLNEVLQKNLDLLQMQLKKEHLLVSFQQLNNNFTQQVSILHFRNSIHLVFQFLLYKLKLKRQNKSNFSGLVEVKISQDQINSYLSFSSNLGPHDLQLNTNDLSLISLEKSILDQGFQLVISEPKPLWMQLLITMPL